MNGAANVLLWVEDSWLSVLITESTSIFAFPFVLFLHTLGLGIVGGLSVAFCIWVLAFADRQPFVPLRKLFPLIWAGFALALLSGLLLLVAYPTKALTDPVFYIKLTLIGIALTLVSRAQRTLLTAGRTPDRRLRIEAAVTIVLWAGVVLTGRLLAYTYNYLTAADWIEGRLH